MNLHKFLPAICFYTLFTSCGNKTKQRDLVSENEKIFRQEDLLNQFRNQIIDGTISQDQISHFFEKIIILPLMMLLLVLMVNYLFMIILIKMFILMRKS